MERVSVRKVGTCWVCDACQTSKWSVDLAVRGVWCLEDRYGAGDSDLVSTVYRGMNIWK